MRSWCVRPQGQREKLQACAQEDAQQLEEARGQEEQEWRDLTQARATVEKQPYTHEQAQAMNADDRAARPAAPPTSGNAQQAAQEIAL